MRSATWAIAAGLACGGCGGDAPEVGYLYVESLDLVPALAAGRSARLETVRAVDGAEALGVYPLPARIPVGTEAGARDIRLEAVVRRAGVAERQAIYPFYAAELAAAPTRSGQLDTVRAEVGYADGTEVVLADDIASGLRSLVVDADGDGATALALASPTDGPVFARAIVTAEHPVLEVATEPLRPDRGGERVAAAWAEFDYRGDAPVRVAAVPVELGEADERTARYRQGVFGREEFGRFHFDLLDEFGLELVASGAFRLALIAVHDPDGPATQTVDVDNVRVLVR